MLNDSKVKDTDAWLLGGEVACILSGGPDMAIVMSVITNSISFRKDVVSYIRNVLDKVD